MTNINKDIEIDHLGIAVNSIDEGNAFWKALGWSPNPETEEVESQKVNVAMLGLNNRANIELLEATDPSSPIAKFMSKRGPGIHHICLRVKNIDQLVEELQNKGIRMINTSPIEGAHSCRVAFVHPQSTGGVLVELSEKAEG